MKTARERANGTGTGKTVARPFYSYVNEEEVEDFLARKPRMEKILKDLSVFLNKTYGVSECRVEHIADDCHGYDTLKVVPNFHTKDWKRSMGVLRETTDAFLYPLGVSPSEDVIISI